MAGKIKVAKFTGPTVVERGLTKEDWAKHDIQRDTVWWTRENNHTVDISDWSAEEIKFLEDQGEFEITEEEAPETPSSEAEGSGEGPPAEER